MRLLWLCNVIPGKVREALTGKPSDGGRWIDGVLAGLRQQGVTIHILCRGEGADGALDDRCSYGLFREPRPQVYQPELEARFARDIRQFRPDVIHIWGTEYGHTLAMMRALEQEKLLDRAVISIQGLCSLAARHYSEGLSCRVQRSCTFRDFVRRDNVIQQQKTFARRGELEIQALRLAKHVIGRTAWDRAALHLYNPRAVYHPCNETLRQPFYQGRWQPETCRKHRIFAPGGDYPVKGFHYLLEAMSLVRRDYPDITLAVPGKSPLKAHRLRRTGYQRYLAQLIREYDLEDRIDFLGNLNAEQMKQAYLEANVFALTSTIENSPNSLGEAMVLGVPCVAADVGGVSSLMSHNVEGYLYPSGEPCLLAHYIGRVFDREEKTRAMAQAAGIRGSKTHDPEKNLSDLMEIYRSL